MTKHLKTNHIPSVHCNCNDPLDFAIIFGDQIEHAFDASLQFDTVTVQHYDDYMRQLVNFGNASKNFKILHLNVDSLFSKIFEFQNILETQLYDLIFLNETKLDAHIPNSNFVNINYKLIRRDRTGSGGGVLVYVKNSVKLKCHTILNEIEAIHMEIELGISEVANFFCCYNPNFNGHEDFISRLETYLFGIDLSKPLFIIGDLNINLSSDKATAIESFLSTYNLRNFVKDPTRQVYKLKKHSRELTYSSTLIDVILHNREFVKDTSVVGCPFSYHNFVACSLDSPSGTIL